MNPSEPLHETRLNVRVKGPLSNHVQQRIGKKGHYKTPSDYVRNLIQQDMEQEEAKKDQFLYHLEVHSLEIPLKQ